MKLFIFEKEINPDYELELVVGSEFGLDITIKYIDDIYDGVEDTKHNCTEFHHLYNKDDKFSLGLSSAFESDIHQTGCTRRVNEIEWIKVEFATELHEKF